MGDPFATVLGPIRTLISLAFLGGLVWFSFSVPLGGLTLAEHMDRIGQTPQARDLVDGTRQTVNPLLEEATDRVLGERVEAPTYVEPAEFDADYSVESARPPAVAGPPAESVAASSGKDVKLPGRRRARP